MIPTPLLAVDMAWTGEGLTFNYGQCALTVSPPIAETFFHLYITRLMIDGVYVLFCFELPKQQINCCYHDGSLMDSSKASQQM